MWPGGMREAIKSAAPVAGVSEIMYKVRTGGFYPPSSLPLTPYIVPGLLKSKVGGGSAIIFFRFFPSEIRVQILIDQKINFFGHFCDFGVPPRTFLAKVHRF